MKKVLVIASFWPYREGSGRVIGLAKCLSEFGWQPIILTPPLLRRPDSQFRVIETPCKPVLAFWRSLFRFRQNESIRRQVNERLSVTSKKSLIDFFLSRVGEIINYPDAYRNWKPFAVKASTEFLQNEHVDAILSIWPVTTHLIAKDLKARYKIPWIADFPDLWSQNHNYQYGPLRRLIDRRLELKVLLSADALTTVSQPWAEKLKTLHKRKSVYVITHGFLPEEMKKEQSKLTSKFTITYTGTIYIGKQNPSKLFAALKDLISDGTMDPNDVEVRFYGDKEIWLAREIEEYGLSSIVKLHGRIPRQIALEKQKESHLLLLLNWEDRQEKGWYSLKIYTYLAAQRPIIAVGGFGNDVVERLLNKTKAGVYCKSVDEIKRALKHFYKEWKTTGQVQYKGNRAEINKYSYKEAARKFAQILDNLVKKGKV